MTLEKFTPRPVHADLVDRYRAAGFWIDDTLGARFTAGLSRSPRQDVVIHSRVRPARETMRTLEDAARRFAGHLRARGLGPSDVVLTQLPNWFEAVVTLCGAQLAGVVIAPVVHSYGEKELLFAAEQTGARLIVLPDAFGSRDFLASVEAVQRSCPSVEQVAIVGDRTADGSVPFASLLECDPLGGAPASDPDDPAIIGFTSGTSADPKGVVHTHRTMLAELRHAEAAPALPPLPGAPSPLVGYPVSHITGLLELLMPVLTGQPINLLDRWEPDWVIQLLNDRDLCMAGGATFFVTSLLDSPSWHDGLLERLRYQGLGGAPVPRSVVERMLALGMKVVRGYGCTEHPSVAIGRWDDDDPRRPFTDGLVQEQVDTRVVDANGDDVTPGNPGELLTRGPDLFAGYLDPALTAAAIVDGWYAIGDVVTIDDDGYVTVVDRVKDIIIRGGENISAAEVEEVLTCLPGVFEAAAVAAPDARYGEHVCAFLQMLPGATVPDMSDVRRAFEAAGLGKQKWPEEIRAIDEFERTTSGKVKKQALRDRLRVES